MLHRLEPETIFSRGLFVCLKEGASSSLSDPHYSELRTGRSAHSFCARRPWGSAASVCRFSGWDRQVYARSQIRWALHGLYANLCRPLCLLCIAYWDKRRALPCLTRASDWTLFLPCSFQAPAMCQLRLSMPCSNLRWIFGRASLADSAAAPHMRVSRHPPLPDFIAAIESPTVPISHLFSSDTPTWSRKPEGFGKARWTAQAFGPTLPSPNRVQA